MSMLRRIFIIDKKNSNPKSEREKFVNSLNIFKDRLEHMIVRIDKIHIELDVKADNETLSEISRYLDKLGYNLVEEVEVDEEDRYIGDWIGKFLNLFNMGRYWEIHEMLEEKWKEENDDFYRVLILLVIPFIKIQMGHYKEAIKGFHRFIKFPYNGRKYGLDISCLKNLIQNKILNREEPELYTPINIKRCME